MDGIELFTVDTGLLTEEAYVVADGPLTESLSSLLPHIKGLAAEDIRSEWDLVDLSKATNGKALPYHNEDSLDKMHAVGFRLYRDPNIQSAIECLLAFVVFKGWSYSISRRAGQEYPDNRMRLLRETHSELLENVNLGNQRGWYFLQKESYRRWLRDGEYFRRWWITDNQLEVRFVEVYDIRQPPSKEKIINLSSLPAFIADQMEGRHAEIPGELGIVSAPGDAASEVGYWYRVDTDNDLYEFIPASRMQHAKCGVDANDPRGVPAFYDGVCPAAQAGSVNEAMNELAVKQSKYAVVHKHRATNRREAIQGLANSRTREMNDQMSTHGRQQAETHVKNVDIEMHGMKAQARNYVQVIQQDQRTLGGLRQIPEYMITNDASTGNRSSLQATNSPFGRRIAQDQKDMWHYDLNLQWNSLLSLLGWQKATADSAKRRTRITVTFPLSETKDPTKDADKVVKLRKDGAISREEQRRQLDVSHEQMDQELEQEGGVFVDPLEERKLAVEKEKVKVSAKQAEKPAAPPKA